MHTVGLFDGGLVAIIPTVFSTETVTIISAGQIGSGARVVFGRDPTAINIKFEKKKNI